MDSFERKEIIPEHSLIDSIRKLFDRLEVDGSSLDLVNETQKRWLREEGSERHEMKELSPGKQELVLEFGAKEGFFNTIYPSKNIFDRLILLGSSSRIMESSYLFGLELYRQGVFFDELIWLTGERSLDPRIDDFVDKASCENDLPALLMKKHPLPKIGKQIKITYLPTKIEGSKSTKRAQTKDTILTLVAKDPRPKRDLFVSHQPFVAYQNEVIFAYLPPSSSFETVGRGIDPMLYPNSSAILLDTLARYLYQFANQPIKS